MVEELNIISASSKTNGNCILELEEEAALNRENVQIISRNDQEVKR